MQIKHLQVNAGQWQELELSYTATERGYLQVFAANESDQEVFFDDMVVEHTPQLIVQENHYYPFGLELEGLSKHGKTEHRWKFQGQEEQKEFGLNWSQFKWRNADVALGRFFSVDPLAEKYLYNSTYAFSENKVVRHIELEGLEATGSPMVDGIINWGINQYVKFTNGIKRIKQARNKSYDNGSGNISSENQTVMRTLDMGEGAKKVNEVVEEVGTYVKMAADEIPVVGETIDLAQGHPQNLLYGMAPFGKTAAKKGKGYIKIFISKSKHPETAQHVEEAQKAGKAIDRSGAKKRRRASLKGKKGAPGKDRDEYPPAVLSTGGKGASVKNITSGDNRGVGSSMGHQMRNLPNGTKVKIVVKEYPFHEVQVSQATPSL